MFSSLHTSSRNSPLPIGLGKDFGYSCAHSYEMKTLLPRVLDPHLPVQQDKSQASRTFHNLWYNNATCGGTRTHTNAGTRRYDGRSFRNCISGSNASRPLTHNNFLHQRDIKIESIHPKDLFCHPNFCPLIQNSSLQVTCKPSNQSH